MSEIKTELTDRNFIVGSFMDRNDEPCSLQESSAIGDYEDSWDCPGSSFLWLGCDKNRSSHLGEEMSPRMHLTREQAKAIADSIYHWLEHKRLPYTPEEE